MPPPAESTGRLGAARRLSVVGGVHDHVEHGDGGAEGQDEARRHETDGDRGPLTGGGLPPADAPRREGGRQGAEGATATWVKAIQPFVMSEKL